MKIFEKKFLADVAHGMAKVDTQKLLEKRDFIFSLPGESEKKRGNQAGFIDNLVVDSV